MCSYTTLHLNDNGYVIRCTGCAGIQLAFGTMVLMFSKAEFNSFCAMVNKEKDKWNNYDKPCSKNIFIPTKSRDIALALSYTETEQLQQLLVDVRLILQADEALNKDESQSIN